MMKTPEQYKNKNKETNGVRKYKKIRTEQAKQQGAEIIVFPGLCLTGYPPEDLLLRPSLKIRIEQALQSLAEIENIVLVLGYPKLIDGQLLNVAGVWLHV